MPTNLDAILSILKQGGFAVLASLGLAWGYFHLDAVTRAERAATEAAFRQERKEERAEWTAAFEKVAGSCLGKEKGATNATFHH